MNKIKIGLSFLCYPLTIARYFWDALERRKDCEVHSVCPFFDDWIPWNGGMRLPRKYVKTPTICLPQSVAQISVPYEVVANQLLDDLDLFIQIDAGFHFSARPKAKIVALIETDPHVLKRTYDLPKSYSDFIFCMQLPYLEESEIYLPYAYDPTIHYPMNIEKEYDACLIGLHYPQRNKLVEKLRAKGLKVYYDIGVIMDEYRLMFNKSKVGLNWSSMLDLNARFFEIPAMGLPMATNKVPNVERFLISDVDYLEFEDINKAVENVLRLLSDDELRKKIAINGHEKIKTETYDARVQTILEACGLVVC